MIQHERGGKMYQGTLTKYLALLCALVLVCSMGGVGAVWIFAEDPANTAADKMNIGLSEFVWAPEEILPADRPGENYLDLLNSILNNSKGGLNSNKGTLENAVKKDIVVHSSQNVQGGNLKHLFITTASQDLDFIVQYISATELHVYIFEDDDVTAGLVNTTQIKVYKTIVLEENGVWRGEESRLGYATIRYVKDTSYLAIDPSEWIYGNLPT